MISRPISLDRRILFYKCCHEYNVFCKYKFLLRDERTFLRHVIALKRSGK